MIPVELTLEGVYSYQKRQTIDFATLTENHIFGIFGGVGSGKSTILEAITFALYGDTERLNNRDNRNYNMMNLKSNQLYIEFIFTAGKNDTKYKFCVSGKRNRNRFEDVKTLNRSAYIFDNNAWIPLESTKADNIIGLSYENFRRTIIIPQGKFQEFLQLGDKARTEMLQEIFRLDRFDLTDKVRMLNSRVDKDIEHNRGQLAGLEEINENLIKQKQSELEDAANELEQAEKKNQSIYKKLKSFEELEKLFERKKSVSDKLSSKKADVEKTDKLEADLKEYLDCKEMFENDINNLNNLLKKHTTIEKEISEAKPKLKNVETLLEEKRNKFVDAEAEQNKKSDYNKQIEDLSNILKIKKLDRDIETKEKDISSAKTKVNKIENDIVTQKDTIRLKEAEHEALSSINDELAMLRDIDNWHKSKIRLIRDLNNYSEKLNNIKTKKKVQNDKLDKILSDNELFEGIPKSDIKTLVNKLEERIAELETEKDKEKTKMLEANARTQIAAEAKNLKEGDPCPVCGSTSHPAIKEFELGTEIVAKSTRILDQIEAQMRITHQQKKELQEIDYILKNTAAEKDEYTSYMQNVNIEIENLIREYKWDSAYKDNKSLLEEAIANAEKKFELYNSISKELKKLRTETEKLSNTLESLKEQLNKSEIEKERLISEKITIDKSIENDSSKDFYDAKPSDINAKIDLIKKHITATENLYKNLTAEIKTLEQQQTGLATTISLKQKELSEISEDRKALQSKIDKNIDLSKFDTIESIKSILARKLDKIKIQKQIDEFRAELSKLQNELHLLEQSIEGRDYNPDEHNNLKQEHKLVKNKIKSITEQIGSLQAAIAETKDKLKIKTELKQKLEKLELRKGNIQVLSRLFHAKGFVNYISTVYLQQLCNLANKRFTLLTNRQLELILNERNNFEVRDYMNGGKVRSVKTLSGGQTFQASLSLALSLAESVQYQAETKQNFFFLDEGFGSLDRNSLQIVFDTLKSLRKENRIVGLISHVEELQEEIDVFLKLNNDPNTGTQINKSW